MQSEQTTSIINRINQSPLLIMDKNSKGSTYSVEKYELIELLYIYLCQLSPKYADMGLEIVETVDDCLNSYCVDKGPFINYFMVAISHKHIGEIEINNVVSYGIDSSGEQHDILLNLSDKTDIEADYLENDSILQELKLIESAYDHSQGRIKNILSMILTFRLLKELPYGILTNLEINKYKFWNTKAENIFESTGEVLSNRSVAMLFGRNEASISRTYNTFIKDIRELSND